jgi:hypothetical protein
MGEKVTFYSSTAIDFWFHTVHLTRYRFVRFYGYEEKLGDRGQIPQAR